MHAGIHPPGAVHAGRYGQPAGGTHPTGMHTCLSMEWNLIGLGGLANETVTINCTRNSARGVWGMWSLWVCGIWG